MIVSHSLGFFTQFHYLCGNFLVLRSPTCQLFVINLRQMELHIESSFWNLYNIGYYVRFLLLVSVFPVTVKPLIHLKLAFVQYNRHADIQFSQCQIQRMLSFSQCMFIVSFSNMIMLLHYIYSCPGSLLCSIHFHI